MSNASNNPTRGALLLVEDEVSVAEALSWALQGAGRVCYRASAVDDAISILEEHHDVTSVLLDRGLVVGALAETVVRIRHAASPVTIIGMSGRHCRDEFVEAGVDDFIAKPLTVKQLLRCVDAHRPGAA